MKLFVLLLLISGSLAIPEWRKTIQLVDKNDPEGKIKLSIDEKTKDLDEILSNPDPRVVDEIYVSSQTIENMTRIFEVYGSKVTKINFNNYADIDYKAQEVLNVLNMLPNLEILKLSNQEKKFPGDVVGTLNVPKLKHLILVDRSNGALDFLAKVLPGNSITTLEIRAEKDFGELLDKQRSIETLKFRAQNPEFDEAFNGLKLEKLELNIKSPHKKNIPNQRKFFKSLLMSQPNLIHLQLVDPSEYSCDIVDDEILAEVKKLSKLESLVLSFDGFSSVEPLQNLKNLKEVYLKASRTHAGELFTKENEELFNTFATFEYPKMESLTINSYDTEISKETYQMMSQNMPNLKFFQKTINAYNTIDTYASLFPQVEELKIRFGNANKPLEFNAALDLNSKVVNENVKKIDFIFQGRDDTLVDANKFVAFINIFPNLESLKISSKFPFTAEFFRKFNENLNNLKVLKLSSFPIDSRETFPAETSNAINALAYMLKYVELNFGNTRRYNDRNHNEAFTFKPFIDAVKDVYKYSEGVTSQLHTYFGLNLKAGKEN